MKRLSQLTPQYSSFVDDQVLTSAKLNEFIEYFDEQDRLSRVCLTGVGITCGFKVTLNAEVPSITISQGCGITTDGDLIKLQQFLTKDELKVTNNSNSFKDISKLVAEINFTHFKPFLDNKANYTSFRVGNSVIDIIELIPELNVSIEDNAVKLTNDQLSNKVVVLYLECYFEDKTVCSSTNCDNQGLPNIQNIKALLIDKDAVEEVVTENDSIYNKYTLYEAITALPRTAIERVILKGEGSFTDTISSYSKLAIAYKNKIKAAKKDLKEAYTNLFTNFSEVLTISNSATTAILNGINNLDSFTDNDRIQYRYTLTLNLSDSFNEIADELLQLKMECCPSIDAFPKHLLLGTLKSTKNYPELRHDFYPAPANSNYEIILKKVQSLLKRVELMLSNFNLNNTQTIGITPSLLSGYLGGKAIPAYFNVTENLLKYWDFKKTQNFKQHYNLSYHTTLLAAGWVKNPLSYELDATDFYRIEGHQGKNLLTVKNTIDTLKNTKGLDFDFLIVDITENQKELAALVREHPGLSHKGGVAKGGTFILLTETDSESVVIADFSLPYKISNASTGISCCSLIECSFPWISSLKYLNNLSRSLKGSKSFKAMPKEYALQVSVYTINGTHLLKGTTPAIIRIPLKEILYRRIHAITDALNKLFDKGVVFDFNESQKRFLITRSKDDIFTLTLQDITMGVNSPVYTYSNSGMFKDHKIFRKDAMRCREIRDYNPSFYEQLQKAIAPINKDDDYGKYDEKWAKWTDLTEKLIDNDVLKEAGFTRMIKNKEQLYKALGDTNITGLLENFQSVVPKNTLKFYIDGDWVNGTWVNDFMLEHRKKNIKNTHDDIVLFVNLRKFLHKETGVTKMSIYIENQEYTPAFDVYLEEYKRVADFYFNARPTGVHAFRLNTTVKKPLINR